MVTIVTIIAIITIITIITTTIPAVTSTSMHFSLQRGFSNARPQLGGQGSGQRTVGHTTYSNRVNIGLYRGYKS